MAGLCNYRLADSGQGKLNLFPYQAAAQLLLPQWAKL